MRQWRSGALSLRWKYKNVGTITADQEDSLYIGLLSVADAGHYADEMQRDYPDDSLEYFHAPTTRFSKEQRECFETIIAGYQLDKGEYVEPVGDGRRRIKPGCEQTLIDAVPQITENFPA